MAPVRSSVVRGQVFDENIQAGDFSIYLKPAFELFSDDFLLRVFLFEQNSVVFETCHQIKAIFFFIGRAAPDGDGLSTVFPYHITWQK